jgi:hypothetical protein
MLETAVLVSKWLSQALILLGGVWAIFSPERELVPRRLGLTYSGWLKLSILALGFSLFALTELQTQAQQREVTRIKNEEIRQQKEQLSYLRKLFLLQHELAAVEVSWPLTDRDQRAFSESLRGFGKQVKGGPELLGNLQYIDTAFRQSMRAGNWLNVRKLARGQFGLQVLVSRPLGMRLVQFSEDEPEWKAFDAAMRGFFGDRFEIEIAPGIVVADLARRHWPCELSVKRSMIHFTIEKPGISLGQLDGASLTFWGGNVDASRVPKEVRIVCRDPKVLCDQKFELRWEAVILYSAKNVEDGYEVSYKNLKTGPFPFSVSIQYGILSPEVDPISKSKK